MSERRVRVGMIGLGKMGMSHCSIVRAHPAVDLVGVADSSGFLRDVVGKYTGLQMYGDHAELLERAAPEAVVIATPTASHASIVQAALERGIHVFVEKPFCLTADEGRGLVALAAERGVVNQVGYHYRFVGAFQEAIRLIHVGALGRVHHVRVEAHGPVVLRPKGGTWRLSRNSGGGCLYDYACHALDVANWALGAPAEVTGATLARVFSRDVEDEVYATLRWADGATGQLAANWSDDSQRKMSTRLTAWGENGKVVADRQECQTYLREARPDAGYDAGWTVRYTTDLTEPVAFYLRGEEYSAQIDAFVGAIVAGTPTRENSFASAHATDEVVAMILEAAEQGRAGASAPAASGGRLRRLRRGS